MIFSTLFCAHNSPKKVAHRKKINCYEIRVQDLLVLTFFLHIVLILRQGNRRIIMFAECVFTQYKYKNLFLSTERIAERFVQYSR